MSTTKWKVDPIKQIAKNLTGIQETLMDLAKLIPRVETLTTELSAMGIKVQMAHSLLAPFADELEELREARRTMQKAIRMIDANVTILTGRPSSLPPATPPAEE